MHSAAERLAADEGYWTTLLTRYGDLSLYDFLRQAGCSPQAITNFAAAEVLESILSSSFLEVLQVELHFIGADMVQIQGGMDRLPLAFLPMLQDYIRFGTEMVALEYTADSVIVHCRSAAGSEQVRADFAILTIPYPAMRFVDVITPFSPGKQAAIRQVHYVNAVKVFLQCRRRFWEEDGGVAGGVTPTDLPSRLIFYPDHGRETGKGVLMAVCAYGEEGNRWSALSADERIDQALRLTAKVYPQILKEFQVGASKSWVHDRYAGGAFTLFDPGQQARLYPHMLTPEGPVHFAGEHASLKHCWIEGAVESGLRAACEIHERTLHSPQP